MPQVLELSSENVFVPLTVGGGIRDYTGAPPIHPINPPFQHTLSTHPHNTQYQLTLLTHPINPPSLPTLPTHPLNTPSQHTLPIYPDADGKTWSALDVASRYFRAGADKVSIGSDAVFAVEEYRASGGVRKGTSCLELISE